MMDKVQKATEAGRGIGWGGTRRYWHAFLKIFVHVCPLSRPLWFFFPAHVVAWEDAGKQWDCEGM